MKFLLASIPPSHGYSSSRSYRPNPYFKKPGLDPVRTRSWMRVLIVVILLIVAGAGAYFLGFSPAFATREVSVQTSDERLREAIEENVAAQNQSRRFFIFPQDNLLAFSATQFEARMRKGEYAGYLDELTVEKVFPHALRITATKREVGMYVVTSDAGYALGPRGALILGIPLADLGLTSSTVSSTIPFDVAPSPQTETTPLIYAPEAPRAAPGEILMPRETAAAILELSKRLRQGLGIKPKVIELDRIPPELVTVHAWNGTTFRFNADDLIPALDRLKAVWLAMDAKERAQVDYVDLRFAERVFVKKR